MKKQLCWAKTHRMSRIGFTLIELLAVIAIIALLIGILVPAVDKIRTQAKVTSTQATLGALGTALEAYKADARVGGGGYPPSVSDRADRKVKSPYTKLGNSQDFEITGAGLLVWALAGADLLGTPGFRTFGNASGNNSSALWADYTTDTSNQNNPSTSGAYALNKLTGSALQTRSGPFMDMSKIRVSKWDAGDKSYEIEAEKKARKTSGMPEAKRMYPMFLDAFGYPILYWRADPAGVQIVDRDPTKLIRPDDRGIYHWIDNGPLIDKKQSATDVLILRPGLDSHLLDYIPPNKRGGNLNPPSFVKYIQNNDVVVKDSPHRLDSYLLVSPGPDGMYGTPDDIDNFEHNGESPSVKRGN